MSKNNIILVAEFLGTFLLVSAVLMGAHPALALGVLVLLIGGISGSHVNPAVSAGMASVKKISPETLIKFWVAQLAGALLARLVYQYIQDSELSLSMTFSSLEGRMFVIELIGGAVFLMGLTLAVTQKLDGIRLAVAVAGSLFLGLLFGGLVNPAVAFGFEEIALASIIGPLIGGVIGVQLGQMIADKKIK